MRANLFKDFFASASLEKFDSLDGTHVLYHILKLSKKVELHPDQFPHEEIFKFLSNYADKFSPRDLLKSAGMLVGQERKKKEIVILISANSVPYGLSINGVNGETNFQGLHRDENTTGHFEKHLYLAAGQFGKLENCILFNCDFMCPNCAKYTPLACDIQHNVWHEDTFKRPIYTERMTKGKEDNSKTSKELLRNGGTQLWQYGAAGLQRVDKDLPIDKYQSPVEFRKVKTSKNRRKEVEAEIIANLNSNVEGAPTAAIMFAAQKGGFHVFYASRNHGNDHAVYNGHHPGSLDPLPSLYVFASAQGYDLTKCKAFMSDEELDVNCALQTTIAHPKLLRLLDISTRIGVDVSEIFKVANQEVLYAGVPYARLPKYKCSPS